MGQNTMSKYSFNVKRIKSREVDLDGFEFDEVTTDYDPSRNREYDFFEFLDFSALVVYDSTHHRVVAFKGQELTKNQAEYIINNRLLNE